MFLTLVCIFPSQLTLAIKHGVVGALVFPDPRSPGHGPNDTYPNSRWTSGEAIFERAMATNLGDPLTPELPSTNGMYRRPRNKTNFAAIPSQPISYHDALYLLSLLKGIYVYAVTHHILWLVWGMRLSLPELGWPCTLEARRADACCKFIEGIQSRSAIARLLCYRQALTNTRDGLRPRANNKRVPYNTDRFGNVVIVKFVYLSRLGLLVIFIFVFMYVVKCCLDNEYNL